MAKKKLLDDIKANPSRFYRLPGDVMRDRRFADGERLEILQAWAADDTASALASQIKTVIQELESRIPAAAPDHAAE